MKLFELLNELNIQIPAGISNTEVKGIKYDSRKVEQGDIFVALRGTELDGHKFVQDAAQKGAIVAFCEEEVLAPIPTIVVPDTKIILATLSSIFWGNPTKKLVLIGITGTNGKTSTSYLIESILKKAGYRVGVIGTISYRFDGHEIPASLTTPQAPEIHEILYKMLASGVTHVIMEISSHALDQRRVWGCNFQLVVFTNLSWDHLDYHRDMEDYFRAKSLLFTSPELGSIDRVKVVNIDDIYGQRLYNMIPNPIMGYSQKKECDIYLVTAQQRGSVQRINIMTPLGELPINTSLLGPHNIYNIMASCGVSIALSIKREKIKEGIEAIKNIPGRLEQINPDGVPLIFVDYAHTPQALETVLKSLRSISKGKIITVFGCGGDRDPHKRPLMGKISGRLSDLTIITQDNPRTEDPDKILDAIEKGIRQTTGRYLRISERREAIKRAIYEATREDCVLIAGKGHESYQIIGNKKIPFDDRIEAVKALREIQCQAGQVI